MSGSAGQRSFKKVFGSAKNGLSIRERSHQPAKAADLLLDLGQSKAVPDVRLTAGYDRLANFSFQQVYISDSRPAGAGDKNAVGFGRLFVEAFGDLVSGMDIHVR